MVWMAHGAYSVCTKNPRRNSLNTILRDTKVQGHQSSSRQLAKYLPHIKFAVTTDWDVAGMRT
jgi:hypothetical protein